MKRIVNTIILLIFIAIEPIDAQFFKNRTEADRPSETTGTLYPTGVGSPDVTNREDYGGFFRSNPAQELDRPGSGDGVGQNATINDGWYVLIACCIVWAIIKKQNKKVGW